MYALMLWTIIAVNADTGETKHGWLEVDHYETVYFQGSRLTPKEICLADAKQRRIPPGQFWCFSEI